MKAPPLQKLNLTAQEFALTSVEMKLASQRLDLRSVSLTLESEPLLALLGHGPKFINLLAELRQLRLESS